MNNLQFYKGDRIALVALSDPRKIENSFKIDILISKLENMGLNVISSKYLYREITSEEVIKEKAQEFNKFFASNEFKAIFDISGGDYANSVLEYLDYKNIKHSKSVYFGYSDLTVIINALYKKCEKYSYLYQIMNILDDEQEELFIKTFIKNNNQLISSLDYTATILGGNIRCFLKLASTEFLPNLDNKILLLESMSGNQNKIETYFRQLKQMKIFEQVSSVILGQFTELDKTRPNLDLVALLKKYSPKNLTILRDKEIGHSQNSKAIIIGKTHSK